MKKWSKSSTNCGYVNFFEKITDKVLTKWEILCKQWVGECNYFCTYADMSRQKTRYSSLRPKGINEAAWREILDAWENGLSDREASFRASKDSGIYITEAELKEIVASSPEISGLRDFLRSDIVSNAKLNIAESIREGSVSTSKWYLERKAAEEFSTKASVAFEGAAIAVTMEEKQRAIDELLESFGVSEKEKAEDVPR